LAELVLNDHATFVSCRFSYRLVSSKVSLVVRRPIRRQVVIWCYVPRSGGSCFEYPSKSRLTMTVCLHKEHTTVVPYLRRTPSYRHKPLRLSIYGGPKSKPLPNYQYTLNIIHML